METNDAARALIDALKKHILPPPPIGAMSKVELCEMLAVSKERLSSIAKKERLKKGMFRAPSGQDTLYYWK